ncbi:hypothetical protein WG68_14350 [Arsukibacterium ikkense]|uniref:Ice-binding protein C-terminal domain-containing protein n=1 Tax=Arsukibacterium ikkense TaxID=336831 RepID=A0A0M2V254_9GAMM|nr:PEP-CTERM sorting domain-containing protein [Arsukibacterium ikkense]KKO44721.1 hypothetical protein WG68_14350 [Arsukibacterium ikkense]
MKTLTALLAGAALCLSGFAHSGIIYDEGVDGNIEQYGTINLELGSNTIIGDSCFSAECNEFNWYISLPDNTYLAAATYFWSSPVLDTDGFITDFWNGRYVVFDGITIIDVVGTQSWLDGGVGFSVTFDEFDLLAGASPWGENRLLFGYDSIRNGRGGLWDFTATFTVNQLTPTLVPLPSTLAVFGLGLFGLAWRRPD